MSSKKISAYSNPNLLLLQTAQEHQSYIKALEIKRFNPSFLLDIPSIPHKSHVPWGCVLQLLFPTSCQVLHNRIWLLFPSPSAQFSPPSLLAPQMQPHTQVELPLHTPRMLQEQNRAKPAGNLLPAITRAQ